MEQGRGCPLTSLEPRTSDRVLVLGEGFLGELDRVLDLVEGFLGELKLVLELVEGFLEELKLVLVIVEFFCLLVQQPWLWVIHPLRGEGVGEEPNNTMAKKPGIL
jgi:hypothetical protein